MTLPWPSKMRAFEGLALDDRRELAVARLEDLDLAVTGDEAKVSSDSGCPESGQRSAGGRSSGRLKRGKGREVARMTGLEPATSGVTGRRSNQLSYIRVGREPMSGAVVPQASLTVGATNFRKVARMTGLEPATSGVTGRRSNQLSYIRIWPRRSEVRPAVRRGGV